VLICQVAVSDHKSSCVQAMALKPQIHQCQQGTTFGAAFCLISQLESSPKKLSSSG
jgi:hypothetical protein